MGGTHYPCVPGHELAGKVTKIGDNVTDLKVGDKVGVGCIVDTCMSCSSCEKGDEQYCRNGMTMTYDNEIKHGHIQTNTGYTFGGYSKKITVHRRYILKIPEAYPLEYAGPLFCAGITMYDPLKHFGAGGGGKRVGIVGIGGLGQMGIRLAVALGNEVTAISTNPDKEAVVRDLGASHFVLSTSGTSMNERSKSLDLILNTISADHQCAKYLNLLDTNGTLVQLGLVMEPQNIMQLSLMFNRNAVAGSCIGGIPDTQECIDFCAEKNIKAEIEVITADGLDEVYEKLRNKNDSIKRYVLDLSNSK